jgi:hypothetical protein
MATFAEQMVEKYEALLLSCAGHQSISIGGQTVSYADLEAKHRHWQRAVAQAAGTKPVASNFDLSKAFDG